MSRLLNPFLVIGKVVKGFGRGSKHLSIPTANIDTDVVQSIDLENGIYYGFCQLCRSGPQNNQTAGECVGSDSNPIASEANPSSTSSANPIYPMVCSLGWNPQFNNTIRSLEVHILHQFCDDFYGSTLRVAICGYIRDEQKFDSLEQLIQTIHKDIDVAKQELKDLKSWSHVIETDFFQQ